MAPMNQAKKDAKFTHLRATFWPSHSHEIKKFVSLSLIMFGLLFIYTIARDTKDTLVINAVGVHIIPFLQGAALTIAGFLFVLVYAKLSNMFSREKLFYIIITPFLFYYAFFGFVIHPNNEWFHPAKETIAALNASFPALSGFIDIYACWSYSLFYILTEIWGNAMIGLMFWEFANHIVLLDESKRFYGLFAVIANVALIISGYFVYFCSNTIQSFLPQGKDAWTISMYLLMGSILLMGVFVISVFRWMHIHILHNGDADGFSVEKVKAQPSQKKSLLQSAWVVVTSHEILLILILVLSYSIAVNVLEMQWKHQLNLFCQGNSGIYNGYMGLYSSITGVFTILCGVFISARLLHSGTWFRAAIITPALFLIIGGLYFIHIVNPNLIGFILSKFSVSPLAFAAAAGGVVVLILKSMKYTLFDPTKEMAYIPLSEELRTKGKAAVDVLGSNLGESGSGYIHIILFSVMVTKDVLIIAPYACAIFLAVCLVWLMAVKVMADKIA
ncbi:MAG: Npt1/Npt2 family nucleotide transporter [Pseudomonadota bacterium]